MIKMTRQNVSTAILKAQTHVKTNEIHKLSESSNQNLQLLKLLMLTLKRGIYIASKEKSELML